MQVILQHSLVKIVFFARRMQCVLYVHKGYLLGNRWLNFSRFQGAGFISASARWSCHSLQSYPCSAHMCPGTRTAPTWSQMPALDSLHSFLSTLPTYKHSLFCEQLLLLFWLLTATQRFKYMKLQQLLGIIFVVHHSAPDWSTISVHRTGQSAFFSLIVVGLDFTYSPCFSFEALLNI